MTLQMRYVDILANAFESVNIPATVSAVSLGSLIKEAREKRNLRQVDVAEAVGIGQNTLSRIEGGETPMPRHRTLLELARVLDIDIGALYVAAGIASTAEQGRQIAESRVFYTVSDPDPTLSRIFTLLEEVDWERTEGTREGILAFLKSLPRKGRAKEGEG